MNDDLTHTVTITITGNYPHGAKAHASVTLSGDGGRDHMIDAFKTALVAAGFSPAGVARLDVERPGNAGD